MGSGLRRGYLARNDYFIVTLTGFIYRLDTWESYTHCTEILFANLEEKDNSALITQLNIILAYERRRYL